MSCSASSRGFSNSTFQGRRCQSLSRVSETSRIGGWIRSNAERNYTIPSVNGVPTHIQENHHGKSYPSHPQLVQPVRRLRHLERLEHAQGTCDETRVLSPPAPAGAWDYPEVLEGNRTMTMKRNRMFNVYVVKERSPGIFRTVRRFQRVPDAVRWLGTLRDQKAVIAGRYSIDAPS